MDFCQPIGVDIELSRDVKIKKSVGINLNGSVKRELSGAGGLFPQLLELVGYEMRRRTM
jgi:hypothetical protein